MENSVVLPQGFKFFVLFDFVSAIKLKNKHLASISDCMPVARATTPTGLQGRSCVQYVPLEAK